MERNIFHSIDKSKKIESRKVVSFSIFPMMFQDAQLLYRSWTYNILKVVNPHMTMLFVGPCHKLTDSCILEHVLASKSNTRKVVEAYIRPV